LWPWGRQEVFNNCKGPLPFGKRDAERREKTSIKLESNKLDLLARERALGRMAKEPQPACDIKEKHTSQVDEPPSRGMFDKMVHEAPQLYHKSVTVRQVIAITPARVIAAVKLETSPPTVG
jgi:hypothetical protein